MSAFRAILLPGIVLPAEPAYSALIAPLGPDVEAVAKDLEVYATPEPPEGYSLEVEVAGVLREADAIAKRLSRVPGLSSSRCSRIGTTSTRPTRIEPERLAGSLRRLWRRAEQAGAG